VALLAGHPIGTMTLERGHGCAACRQTGYRGRSGVFELLDVTPEVQHAVLTHVSASAVRNLAQEQGMVTVRQDGWTKVQAGITTVEEVLRVADI